MERIISLLILIALVGCQSPEPYTSPKEKQTAPLSFVEYSREMKLEYGLNLIDQKIDENKASFDFYHYAEVEPLEARLLIHGAARELQRLLSNKEIAITISFIDPITHKRYHQDKIAVVSLLDGCIHYSSYNQELQKLEEVLTEEFVFDITKA